MSDFIKPFIEALSKLDLDGETYHITQTNMSKLNVVKNCIVSIQEEYHLKGFITESNNKKLQKVFDAVSLVKDGFVD